ncbi:unknown protein [Microcystis aeruginosa NIES-843]|uniref:Uncharacterized protein n=1 Tax=Microcystis aeruginosa (strain NIES-843 / IAM M-2473) TaxID=449447 RepID=B0JQQ9_MICAN|nr:unknown protein [Microcystis aeruginosa NIES-843]
MNGAIADPNNPRLSIRQSFIKSPSRSHRIVSKLKRSSFDVDRHNSAMITFLNLGAHLRFINLIATSGKLFFAVAGLSNCHRFDLFSTMPLHFTLSNGGVYR